MYIFKLSNWYRNPLHPSLRKTTLALNPSSLPFKRLITSKPSVLHYSQTSAGAQQFITCLFQQKAPHIMKPLVF